MTQKSHSWAYTQTKLQFKTIHAPPLFIAALLTIAEIWKQPKCPSTDEGIKKMYVYTRTHTHNVILLSYKKE